MASYDHLQQSLIKVTNERDRLREENEQLRQLVRDCLQNMPYDAERRELSWRLQEIVQESKT